ncbi:MAG: anaerobic ribonucleoside-triphosphate reductase [Acetobacteraceae bacterium]|nr:anaerobic ribonucleoside-triphosphate reductase [Acetobacteraceae bacterium]
MNEITPVVPDGIELRDEERQPCEIWTRVMGYHRPVSSFNRGKQGEFGERVYFSEARAAADCDGHSGN